MKTRNFFGIVYEILEYIGMFAVILFAIAILVFIILPGILDFLSKTWVFLLGVMAEITLISSLVDFLKKEVSKKKSLRG